MITDFDDEYMDVLQNIEVAIIRVYREDRDLTDYEVDKVINGLIRAYQAEQQQRAYQKPDFSPLGEQVYKNVESMCNWRLGRTSLESDDHRNISLTPDPITLEEAISCLKRIRRSVKKWNKRGGSRGYLQYVDQFIG